MEINPLRETYAAPRLPAHDLLSLWRGLPCMRRSTMFEIYLDGLKLPPLVLQAQRLERLHKFLTAEPREKVRCKMPHAPLGFYVVPLVRGFHPILYGVKSRQPSIAVCDEAYVGPVSHNHPLHIR